MPTILNPSAAPSRVFIEPTFTLLAKQPALFLPTPTPVTTSTLSPTTLPSPTPQATADYWSQADLVWPGRPACSGVVQCAIPEDWIVYQDITRTLQFRYPANWTMISNEHDVSPRIQERLNVSFLDLGEHTDLASADLVGHDVMGLTVFTNQWASFEAFIEEMSQETEDPANVRFPYARIVKRGTINGREGIYFIWDNMVTGKIYSIAIPENQWLYIWHTWPSQVAEPATDRIALLEIIISSIETYVLPETGGVNDLLLYQDVR